MLKNDKYFNAPRQYHALFCNAASHAQVVDDLKILRKKIFVDAYGWTLPTKNNREQDQFDQDYTIYCALYYQKHLIGTFRAIRTDYPYLTPNLVKGEPTLQSFPHHRECWEISRFGVLPQYNSERHGLINYSVLFYFAQMVGAQKLIATTDLIYERFLSSLGIHTRRYCHPQIIGMDRSGKLLQVVAGEILLGEQNSQKLQKVIHMIDKVKVTDAAHVFRPETISA